MAGTPLTDKVFDHTGAQPADLETNDAKLKEITTPGSQSMETEVYAQNYDNKVEPIRK